MGNREPAQKRGMGWITIVYFGAIIALMIVALVGILTGEPVAGVG